MPTSHPTLSMQIPPSVSQGDWLPPCEWETGPGECRTCFTIPLDFPFFDGHFENHPILPAYVQANWMLAAARQLGSGNRVTFRQIKWLRPIGASASVELRAVTQTSGYVVTVVCDGNTCAQATLIFS